MTLNKTEQQILKTHAEILEPMITRRIDELKELLYKIDVKEIEEFRGRAKELAELRGIIKDLASPKKTKKPDNDI